MTGSKFVAIGGATKSQFFFFFNDTATTEIYTLSLHDALPISNVFANKPFIYFSTIIIIYYCITMTMGKKNMGLIFFSISLFLLEIKLEFWQMELYFEIELEIGRAHV